MGSPTLALGSFIAEVCGERLPIEVSARLGDLFLDYLRVASIGASMPWSDWARAYAAQLGGGGKAGILFSADRTNPQQASFLNATYAGSTDSDDTHVGSMLHPGAIVFSAAFALGTEQGAKGGDFLAAVAAGYETMIRIGLAIQPSHFRRGFQSTSTCGVFGAAAAAARLLFRGGQAARHISGTLGLAASFASGVAQFYHSGSTVKRIHAAHAAESGVEAALLASKGFSGPMDVMEGKSGFAHAFSDGADFEPIFQELGTSYRLLEVTVKVHACSARVQTAVEGVLKLGQREGFGPEDVAEVYVGVPSVVVGRLTLPRPVDVQAAQMSLPFSVALALARLRDAGPGFSLGVADYERGLSGTVVRELEERVHWAVDPEVEAATTVESVPAKVAIRLRSGKEHSIFVPTPTGSPSRPLTHEEYVLRFHREVGKRLPERCRASLVKISENLAKIDSVEYLAGLLAGNP